MQVMLGVVIGHIIDAGDDGWTLGYLRSVKYRWKMVLEVKHDL